jgi:NarL family two-component system response regulator LiaR
VSPSRGDTCPYNPSPPRRIVISVTERIPILLADEHTNVRARIYERLMREPTLDVVALAETSREAVDAALACHPAVVLIDPIMRDGLGLDAIRQIFELLPTTAIVVLSAAVDTAQLIELRKLGVKNILNKGIESQKLIQVLSYVGRTNSSRP